jgi:hypothetical protein
MEENRNKIPDFPRGDTVANFQVIISHDHFVACLYGLSAYPSLMCVLCKEGNYITNRSSSRQHSFQLLEYQITCEIILG